MTDPSQPFYNRVRDSLCTDTMTDQQRTHHIDINKGAIFLENPSCKFFGGDIPPPAKSPLPQNRSMGDVQPPAKPLLNKTWGDIPSPAISPHIIPPL